MEITELMINDLVSRNGEVYKVSGILGNAQFVQLFPVNVKNKEGKILLPITIRVKVVRPIPLTEEILKANGFIYKDTMEEWWHETYNTTWGMKMSDFELTNEFKIGRAQTNFVYQLQHALRLCGLNELADNLKV